MDKNDLLYDLILNENFKRHVLSYGEKNSMLYEDFLIDHPNEEETFRLAVEIVLFISKNGNTRAHPELCLENYEKIIVQINLEKQKAVHLQKQRKIWKYQVAAVILLCVGITVLFKTQDRDQTDKLFANDFVEIRSEKGERRHVFLPDSSEVWLNSNSLLRYPNKFSSTLRNVDIKGEAFFKVTHNPGKPFIVSTGKKYQIKVLGTSFDVVCNEIGSNFKTTLFTGCISLSELNNREQIVSELKLMPGEQVVDGSFTANGSLQKKSLDPDELECISAWKNNILMFKNARLKEIALQMESWYGIKIRIEGDNLMNERFTGAFYNQESVSEVLAVFSKTTPIKYSFDKNMVTISKIESFDAD
jgi:ferric-dicitrate binding protein FerR (iron transport regulator)